MFTQKAQANLPTHCDNRSKKGWSGLKNGKLLQLMRDEVDIFLLINICSISTPSNIIALSIIVRVALDNRLVTLQPLMPEVRNVVDSIRPGEFVAVPRLAQTAPAEAPNITIDGDD